MLWNLHDAVVGPDDPDRVARACPRYAVLPEVRRELRGSFGDHARGCTIGLDVPIGGVAGRSAGRALRPGVLVRRVGEEHVWHGSVSCCCTRGIQIVASDHGLLTTAACDASETGLAYALEGLGLRGRRRDPMAARWARPPLASAKESEAMARARWRGYGRRRASFRHSSVSGAPHWEAEVTGCRLRTHAGNGRATTSSARPSRRWRTARPKCSMRWRRTPASRRRELRVDGEQRR